MKAFLVNLWDKIKSFVKGTLILGIVPATVAVLQATGLMAAFGPVLLSVVMVAVAVLFVTIQLTPNLRAGVWRFITHYGGWLDLVAVAVITCLALEVGATVGMIALTMGLSLSAMFSIVRISQIVCDPNVRAQFAQELGGRMRRPKPRNYAQAGRWATA
jgi:hypothetical protein